MIGGYDSGHVILQRYNEPVSNTRYKLAGAYSDDSNQSAHAHSLIRVLVFRLKICSVLGYP